jgi:hypothetical protein
MGAATGKQQVVIPAMTPERAARIDQEMRYVRLFGQQEGFELLAKSYEAKGDTAAAASWRAEFARRSGLTPEEAEKVKRIATQYTQDFLGLNADCTHALLTALAAHVKVQHSDPKSIPVSCQRFDVLFPKVMADLLAALGSESFTRLDSYTRHRLDNARPPTPSPIGQPSPAPARQ